jgi:hypothetical protein
MGDHICTTRDLCAGGFETRLNCLICCKETKHICGYIGPMCDECGIITDEGSWRGEIVRHRRERMLKMSIEELADLTRHKKKTIRRYEQRKCPDSYWKETEFLCKVKWNIETSLKS